MRLRARLVRFTEGTKELVPGGRPKIGIQIKASKDNQGVVYLGGSEVTSEDGYPLDPGENIFLPIDITDGLYGFAEVNGDKVNYLYM